MDRSMQVNVTPTCVTMSALKNTPCVNFEWEGYYFSGRETLPRCIGVGWDGQEEGETLGAHSPKVAAFQGASNGVDWAESKKFRTRWKDVRSSSMSPTLIYLECSETLETCLYSPPPLPPPSNKQHMSSSPAQRESIHPSGGCLRLSVCACTHKQVCRFCEGGQ